MVEKLQFQTDILDSTGRPYTTTTVYDMLEILQSAYPDEIYVVPRGTEEIDETLNSNLTKEQRAGFRILALPDGVKAIGSKLPYDELDYELGVFSDFTNLEYVLMPDSVESIGTEAFRRCSSLKSIKIPSSLNYIGADAFSNSGLKTLKLPRIKTIEYNAFADCTSLTTASLDWNLDWETERTNPTIIGHGVFSGCSSLKSLTIPFVGRQYHVGASDPGYLGYIFGAEEAWKKDTNNQDISKTNTSYKTNYQCVPASLKSVTISSGNEIPGHAFRNCTNIEKINIWGSDQVQVGGSAFQGCSALATVNFPGEFDREETHDYKIINSAFDSCTSLKSIVLPEYLKEICAWAFCNSGLTSIEIPESVTFIGNNVFNGCTNLATLSGGEGLQKVDYKPFHGTAFYNNSANWIDNRQNGRYLYFPDSHILLSVSTDTTGEFKVAGDGYNQNIIGGGAFEGCTKITSIILPGCCYGYKRQSISSDQYKYTRSFTHAITEFSNASNFCGHLEINDPKLVKVVSSTNEITEPDILYLLRIDTPDYGSNGNFTGQSYDEENDEYYAEYKEYIYKNGNIIQLCDSYADPEYSQELYSEYMGYYTKLSCYEYPEHCTSIGAKAFVGCKNLTAVTIPNSVTYVGADAFNGLGTENDPIHINYNGTVKQLQAIQGGGIYGNYCMIDTYDASGI